MEVTTESTKMSGNFGYTGLACFQSECSEYKVHISTIVVDQSAANINNTDHIHTDASLFHILM